MRTKATILCFVVLVMFSSNVSAFGVFDDIDSIDSSINSMDKSLMDISDCFSDMNYTMNNLLGQLMFFTTSTKADFYFQITELNGHLSDLERSVSNFSSSTTEMKQSIKEVEDLKNLVIPMLIGSMVFAVMFLVVFIAGIWVVVKKMDGKKRK